MPWLDEEHEEDEEGFPESQTGKLSSCIRHWHLGMGKIRSESYISQGKLKFCFIW